MAPRRFRSLASRLAIVGLVQLALLAATAIVIFYAEGPHQPGRPEDHVDRALVSKLESLVDQPAALQVALDDLLAERIEVSLYDDKKQLVATNVEPAPRPRRLDDLFDVMRNDVLAALPHEVVC